MLSVRGLDAFYGGAQVLFGVDLEVPKGGAVALLGRNGSGKSTTMKALMGLVRTRASAIELDGGSLLGLPPYRICRAGLGYVPEERRIFTDLTVGDNLAVAARPARDGLPPWTVERLMALFPNLDGMRGRRAAHISGGEQQMLAVARTLMGNPAVLLLDEPAEGLAPRILDQLAEAILDVKAHGLSILLSEQNLGFASRIADHALVMETGHVAWSGPISELSADKSALHRLLSA